MHGKNTCPICRHSFGDATPQNNAAISISTVYFRIVDDSMDEAVNLSSRAHHRFRQLEVQRGLGSYAQSSLFHMQNSVWSLRADETGDMQNGTTELDENNDDDAAST